MLKIQWARGPCRQEPLGPPSIGLQRVGHPLLPLSPSELGLCCLGFTSSGVPQTVAWPVTRGRSLLSSVARLLLPSMLLSTTPPSATTISRNLRHTCAGAGRGVAQGGDATEAAQRRAAGSVCALMVEAASGGAWRQVAGRGGRRWGLRRQAVGRGGRRRGEAGRGG
eukprot:scaffold12800_cov56-Phaeocystis_antarctica.AAC.6